MVLFAGYGFLVLDFALKAAVPAIRVSPLLGLHAFTRGGIGLFTPGMMTRVSTAHTGGDIFAPLPALPWMFTALRVGALLRLVAPLIEPTRYLLWIGLSHARWIAELAVFLITYLPVLWNPVSETKRQEQRPTSGPQ